MSDRQRHPVWTLLLLTLVAGVLRFSFLDKPAVWGDEAATWRRVSGNWQQLLNELRTAGFMPGHYVLTWWVKEGFPISGEWKTTNPEEIERGFGNRARGRADLDPNLPREQLTPTHRLVEEGLPPTPIVLRFMPALCGTLMVPAMYFLASRLVARRTALLVAIFTCFSAYMLNYSRDAKMYMQFWFFATLHVGCLLWWLEAYRSPAKPPAKPKQPATDSTHGVIGVLSNQHVGQIARAFAAEERRHTPAHRYPARLDTTVRWMCWLTSGLAMIAFHAIGLGIIGIEVLIFLATIPLRCGWVSSLANASTRLIAAPVKRLRRTGPSPDFVPHQPTSPLDPPAPRPRMRLFLPPVIGFLLGVAAVVSLWLSYKEFTRFYERVNPADEIARVDLNDAGISWVEPYNRGRSAVSHVLYNATAYLMNWEWVADDDRNEVNPRALQLLQWSAASLLIVIAAGVVPWRQLFFRKPADVSRVRGTMPVTATFILACWLLIPAYGFYAASGAWNEAGRKARAVGPTQALLLLFFPQSGNDDARKLAGTLGADLSANDRVKGVADGDWRGMINARATAIASHDWSQLFIVRNVQLGEARWWMIGSVAGVVLLMLLNRWYTWRQKAMLIGRVVIVLAIVWLLTLFAFVFTPVQAGSVWMPRYLCFVWPAFAIILCVLIRRLPFAPLRWLVVIGLIATNLTVFYHRVTLGEPPTDLIAKDYKIARDSDAIRMFAKTGGFSRGAPGDGTIISMPAVYYVSIETQTPMSSNAAIRMMRDGLNLDAINGDLAAGIRQRLNRDEKADEFYVWTERGLGTSSEETEAAIRKTLDDTWTRVEPPLQWTVYEHWTWRERYRFERHHWKRTPADAVTTAPATQPE